LGYSCAKASAIVASGSSNNRATTHLGDLHLKYFVGIDIGGTTTTLAVGDAQHNILWVSDQFPTEAALGPHACIGNIAKQLQIATKVLQAEQSDFAAVGLSTPGPATLDGTLRNSPNLKHPDWNNFSIRGGLESQLRTVGFNCEVSYIGDGQAAAFGEFQVRSGRWRWNESQMKEPNLSLRSIFMVIVGTGLGGGEVRDGKVVRGAAGRAGHAGHIFLPPSVFRYEHDAKLLVGNTHATVESAVSLTGLTHQLGYRLQLPKWQQHPLHQATGTMRDRAKTLRQLADQGDPLAVELFEDQARALGVALLSVCYVGDFDLIVVGGGVCDLSSGMRETYMRHVKKSFYDNALDGFRSFEAIEFSVCGDTAPVIGAAAFAEEHLKA
jgi:glucokinase